MFELNPLLHENAWWQHLIMFAGAGLLGYVIGFESGDKRTALHNQLINLQAQLVLCKETLVKPNDFTNQPEQSQSLGYIFHTIVQPDDLKKIEGIGPKIEELLNQNGILTFIQLSEASVHLLKQLLQEAGPRFQMHDPTTWPRQAELAASGKWKELKDWQDILNKGKE